MLWHCSPWGEYSKKFYMGRLCPRYNPYPSVYHFDRSRKCVPVQKDSPCTCFHNVPILGEFIVKKGTLLVIFMWCLHLINEMEQSKCVCVWNIRSFLWKHEMTDFPFIYLGLCNPYTWRLKTAPLLGEVPPGHLQSCPVLGNGRKGTYYMTNSVSGQDEPNLVLWLATWAGSMELYCPLRIRALSRKENLS